MKNTIRRSFVAVLSAGALLTASAAHAQTQKVEASITTTTTEGTVSEFGGQSIIVKTAPGTQPVRYISSETTNYVDEDGNRIPISMVKSGLPVTVYYIKVGDTLVASKVMVKRGAVTAPAVITTTQTETTSMGTISEFGTEKFDIRTETSPTAVRYSYGKTTTYVDERGRPVSIKTVKSGLPVTVYYTKIGDSLVASKVIVRSAAFATDPLVEQKTIKTTTTTETKR